MNNPTKHIEEHARGIRLSSEERLHIRERLERHMLEHPLRPVPSPYQRYFQAPAFMFAALFLVVLGGSGTLAAKSALPGQALYGLKVGVVEPLQGTLQFTSESQTLWQVQLATTRLEEAQQLQNTGTLTSGDAVTLSERFSTSAVKAASEIGRLAPRNPKAAKSAAHDFETALAEHAEVVSSLAVSSNSTTTPVFSALLAKGRKGTDRTARTAKTAAPETAQAMLMSMPAPAATTTLEIQASADVEVGSDDAYTQAEKIFQRVYDLASEDEEKGVIQIKLP